LAVDEVGRDGPGEVPGRRFDLDDPGAQIAEQLRPERARQVVGQVQHRDAGQRTSAHDRSFRRRWMAQATWSRPETPPPVVWVRATRAPSTCRWRAVPRSCQTASQIWATPVAPAG